MSLQTEIDQAGADLIKELKDKKIPLPSDAEVETTVEEEPEVEVEAEQEVEEEDETALPEIADLTDDEQAEAQKFYRLMKDPATRILLVKEMAENAGLLKDISPASKPKEIAAAKKSIQETLEEELGPTLKFMVPGLSKAIDKILAQEREEGQTAISELSQQQVLSETSKVLDKLARETNGASRKFENQMASYIEKYPMANGQDVESYLREMLTLASKGQTKAITTKQINNKIRTAANNVSDRLPRTSSSIGSDALPTGKMSLDESVRWAARTLQRGPEKPVNKRK